MNKSFHRYILDRIYEAAKTDKLIVAASCSFAILIVFYGFTLASFLQLQVYPIANRATYYTIFSQYIVDQQTDYVIVSLLAAIVLFLILKPSFRMIGIPVFALLAIIAHFTDFYQYFVLTTLPLILMLFILSKFYKLTLPRLAYSFHYFSLVIISLAVGSFLFLFGVIPRDYLYELFVAATTISPILLLIMMTNIPVNMIISQIKSKLFINGSVPEIKLNRKHRLFYLVPIVVLSLIIVSIPHFVQIDRNYQQIGVDTGYYVNWLSAIDDSEGIGEFLENTFVRQSDGDRPFSLILMWLYTSAVGSTTVPSIEILPFILSPVLVLVMFFLAQELWRNEKISLLVALLTTVSFQTLIGVYAGFYSNWIAIIFGFTATIFLLRYHRYSETKDLLLYAVFLMFLLLSHVYTWSVFSIVHGAFLVWMWARKTPFRKIMFLLAIIGISIGVDIIRITLTGSTGGLERDIELTQEFFSQDRFILRWNNLNYSTFTFLGGLFGNFLLFSLAIYWLLHSRFDRFSDLFLMTFLSIGVIPFLFAEFVIQTRVMYDIPFQLPAAFALYQIGRKNRLLAAAICVLIVLIGIRNAANFYLVLPF